VRPKALLPTRFQNQPDVGMKGEILMAKQASVLMPLAAVRDGMTSRLDAARQSTPATPQT
jgi:hypothetical protein